MNQIYGAIEIFEQAVILAVFVVVFIVCLRVLPEMGFTGFSRIVLAVCVAVLSAMGVALLGPATANHVAPQANRYLDWDFLLLPYTALGLSLLVFLVFFLFRRFGVAGKSKHIEESPRRLEAKESQFERKGADLLLPRIV